MEIFLQDDEELPASTVNWRLHEMEKTGILQRMGRGRYRLPEKSVFTPEIPDFYLEVSSYIKKHFPLVAYCLWDFEIVRSLSRHMPAITFTIVDVEKTAIEAVFDKLKDRFEYVYHPKDFEMAFNYHKFDHRIVFVKPLATESPVRMVKNIPVPELEKILVDAYCDTGLFGFLQGKEWQNIWENALLRYAINTTRLLRYAARRGQRAFFYKMLHHDDKREYIEAEKK